MNRFKLIQIITSYLIAFLFPVLVSGQRVTEIKVLSSEIAKYSNTHFMGHLLPVSATKSIVDFGNIKLALLNNNSGEIIRYLDETELQHRIEERMPSYLSNNFSFYQLQQIGQIPSCSSYPFIFCKPTQINDSEIVIELSLYLKNNHTSENLLTRGVLYLTPELEIVDFVFMDMIENESFLATSEDGWFWLDENNVYIKKFLISDDYFDSMSKAFAHFKKVNNSFIWIKDLEISDLPRRKNLALGRNFSIRQVQGNYYINNDSIIIKTKDLINIDESFKPTIHENESLCNFVSIGDAQFVGLIKQLDGTLSRIVKLDRNFKVIKDVSQYNDINYSVNSIELHGKVLHILIYDEKKKKYLLEKINV